MRHSSDNTFDVVMLLIVAVVVGPFLHAAVIMLGWNWFVFPTLGVARPPLATLIGFMMTVRLIFGIHNLQHEKSDKKNETVGEKLAQIALEPVLFMAIMFLIHLFQ